MNSQAICKAEFAPTSQADASPVDRALVEQAVRMMLRAIGEDVEREGLLQTPSRVARMMIELTSSINADPADQITCEFFEESAGLVLVKDITFNSTCEHHMLPFHGVAHVAYLPKDGRITGLSKLARVVEVASKRLQVQERLTAQVAQAIEDKLDPLGVFVMIEAEHSCIAMRGIKKPGSKTITTVARGVYKKDASLRSELLSLIKI
ncbi:GTP cyclohydrolase I FolE [soil metagenome]